MESLKTKKIILYNPLNEKYFSIGEVWTSEVVYAEQIEPSEIDGFVQEHFEKLRGCFLIPVEIYLVAF